MLVICKKKIVNISLSEILNIITRWFDVKLDIKFINIWQIWMNASWIYIPAPALSDVTTLLAPMFVFVLLGVGLATPWIIIRGCVMVSYNITIKNISINHAFQIFIHIYINAVLHFTYNLCTVILAGYLWNINGLIHRECSVSVK